MYCELSVGDAAALCAASRDCRVRLDGMSPCSSRIISMLIINCIIINITISIAIIGPIGIICITVTSIITTIIIIIIISHYYYYCGAVVKPRALATAC